jgi:hypothetical protein
MFCSGVKVYRNRIYSVDAVQNSSDRGWNDASVLRCHVSHYMPGRWVLVTQLDLMFIRLAVV